MGVKLLGGYLSIGLVYEDINSISRELKGLVTYLQKENINLTEIHYSQDEDGERWVENKVNDINIIYSILKDKYFLSLKMDGDLFKIGTRNFIIRINREEGYFGFLMDIEWRQLIDKDKEEMSKRIVNSLIHLLKFTDYDYSYCGHEAEIEYSPTHVKNIKDIFPITLLNLKNKIELIYGEFNIDGISFQQKSHKIFPIE